MSAYLVWRLLKFLALALWGAGLYSVLCAATRNEAQKALYQLVIPAFSVLWITGWMMMKLSDLTMAEPWISQAMLLSLLSLAACFQRAHSLRLQNLCTPLALAGFMAATASMIFRGPEQLATGIALAMGVGIPLGFVLHRGTTDEPVDATLVEKGFGWVARCEGLTVLVLFGVFMPFKYALGINIDGGTGVVGWTHGVFVILYLLSLTYTRFALRWSWLDWVLGGIVSFFPFGTFWFERRMKGRRLAAG